MVLGKPEVRVLRTFGFGPSQRTGFVVLAKTIPALGEKNEVTAVKRQSYNAIRRTTDPVLHAISNRPIHYLANKTFRGPGPSQAAA